MPHRLLAILRANDPKTRDTPVETACEGLECDELLAEAAALDDFYRGESNLYARVRALLFLYALHRYLLPRSTGLPRGGRIPFDGVECLWNRRFEDAIDRFRAEQAKAGPSDALASALAAAYRELAFQTLADQVRRSVRSHSGNQWMFQVERPEAHPLRIHDELMREGVVLRESTPVRMDLTHSGWSDIFFLGMDYPEGARVLNVSIDLGVRGRDDRPRPPVESFLRVIDRPVMRLISLDLECEAEITDLEEVFDFAKDYLGLLKAAVISSGLVPPSLENGSHRLEPLLARLVGPGRGLEIVSHVRGIPKGSRLAVSTSLLASLIALCMRATGQTRSLEGPLDDDERRLIVARAILGEWLGGSGGGWQDSGGLWPSIKLIEGALAEPGDPEYGVSRGRLLPRHRVLGDQEVPRITHEKLQQSLVLIHGGMAQNVGPILEMVTERYLLRTQPAWDARQQTKGVLDAVLRALKIGDMWSLGRATHDNFHGPIQTIIPWATNAFTEKLIERVRSRFGDQFYGFWMLGGMSGGGMGLLFDSRARAVAQQELPELLRALKREFESALPFAMDPVVYDFAINARGTVGDLVVDDVPLPKEYYTFRVPRLLRVDPKRLSPETRAELRKFGFACSQRADWRDMPQVLFRELFAEGQEARHDGPTLDELLAKNGFDSSLHEEIRQDLRNGRIGLARNRLPVESSIQDVADGDVTPCDVIPAATRARGEDALRRGAVGVVTLAGGAGSRWTQGAGVVKALHPFCRFGGAHRNFVEVHLAKTRRTASRFGATPQHAITTSYLTHGPIADHLAARDHYRMKDALFLSPARSVGLRLVPMERDLRFLWEETTHPLLDEQKQKVRDSAHAALLGWARSMGEGADYRDNLALQCLHPVGHWYEVPNLLLNGVLAAMLDARPQLETLLLHNVDTVGADLDPALLGHHLERRDAGAAFTFEVVHRRIEDRGGGLARVNGRPRIVESLALPRERDEFDLSYYNSLTTWIDIDRLLALFQLTRGDLRDAEKTAEGVRRLARRMPTYVTVKDVKKRWGFGQEDVFPVAQFEKLWGDMSALPEITSAFVVVPRERGQQLKDPAQLDGWLRDGSASCVERLCEFG
jgi:hypothetical protein